MDIYIKGEPPISEKFNSFTKNYAQDINILAKQIDYLSANVINIFNLFTLEVEKENSFVDRIKNKVKILQMYSSSPANDIFYFGGTFDSNEYIDYSSINENVQNPLIENGALILPTSKVTSWIPNRVTIDSNNSNGFEGNNHACYSVEEPDGEVFRYFFTDVTDTRLKNNIIDNNPLKFYEYEQIHITNKTEGSQPFEFKYLTTSSLGQTSQQKDWSTFTQDPLKLTLEFDSASGKRANFVKITPYFGNANYISRDILVKRIEVTNNLNEVEEILKGQSIYISSSFIPSSLEASRNFYYREANIKFKEREVKKFKIFFEQLDHTPVKIKHLYFEPQDSSNVNPYVGQTRFNPYQPSTSLYRYPNIPWSQDVGINLSSIMADENNPNKFKISAANTLSIPVRLTRQIPKSSGKTIAITSSAGELKYITGNFFNRFDSSQTIKFPGLSETNFQAELFITNQLPRVDNPLNTAMVVTQDSLFAELTAIVTWFATTDTLTPAQKLEKFGLEPSATMSVIDIDSVDTTAENFQRQVNLIRRYEHLDGFRRSISLRDVSFGYEEYAENTEIVSRQFDLPYEIEYMTISSEFKFSGETTGSEQDLIQYYISVDQGSNWLQISPIENPFIAVPEVIAFNQNIDSSFRLPGVEYYTQPSVPISIKGFSVKIVLKKPFGQNLTPMIYSYKVGAKVRQLWQYQTYKKESSYRT